MAKIDKQELIAKVKGLDGLTSDEKAQIIGFIKTKTYGLVWENYIEKSWEQLKDYIPVLVEDKNKEIIKDTDAQKNPNHILIEGDNLLALTNLCYTHAGKVDVIYIDPPYNTGNKDFVYNDKFVDKDDEYRHSKWLAFMNRRLRMAKYLLSNVGIIFISIDDNEYAELKMLCDTIFGEKNFVENFSWRKTETPAHLSTKTTKTVEYVLCYTKTQNDLKFRGIPKVSLSNNGLMNQPNAVHNLTFPAFVVDTKLKNGIYPKGKYGTKAYDIELLEDTEVKDGYFVKPVVLRGRFKWAQDNLEKEISRGTKISIKTKAFSPSYDKVEYDPEVPTNFIDKNSGVDTNETATSMLNDIIPDKEFNNPKPISLIKYLINFIDAEYVLDFFAGSGTTLHAVMELNKEDNGRRKCILVQGHEKKETEIITENEEKVKQYVDYNICEEVTYERNKRVINGYTKPNGESVEGLHNNNLRYFKVGFTHREKELRNIERFAHLSVPMLCIKEDVYKEQKSLGEIECDGFRYFKDGNKQFIVILEPDMIEPIVAELAKMDVESRIPVYVFTMGQYPYTEDFWQVSEKVELYPYPSCVYGACEKVMPKMEDKLIDQPEDIELSDEEANMTFDDLSKE